MSLGRWLLMGGLLYGAAWCGTAALYINEWRDGFGDIDLDEVLMACFLVGPLWPIFLPGYLVWKAITGTVQPRRNW